VRRNLAKYFQTRKVVQLKFNQNAIHLYVQMCFIDLTVCYFREIPNIVSNGTVHYKKGVGLYSGRREKLIVAESGGEVVKLLLMTDKRSANKQNTVYSRIPIT